MKKWRFGIVGAGLIAEFHIKAIADIDAQLIAVCDINKARADKMASKHNCKSYGSYQELCQDKEIDIVTIATPSGLHMEPSIAAAEAGKHVICEKPMEVTTERIDEILCAHKKAGTRICTIFPTRFHKAFKPIKEAVAKGRFGRITFASVSAPFWRTDEYYNGTWHGTWKLDGGGALMNQTIHTIDLLCAVLPQVESVQAYMNNLAHPQIEAEDTAVAVLKFVDGTLGSIYGTTGSYPGEQRCFTITGTNGTVVLRDDMITTWQFRDELPEDEQIRQRFAKTDGKSGVADPADISHQGHTDNFKGFINCLESGEKFELEGNEGRKSVQLIRAIYQSAKDMKMVKLCTAK